MGLLDDISKDFTEYKKDKQTLDKLKQYADLNKDGKLDKSDVDKAKAYETTAKNMLDKFGKK